MSPVGRRGSRTAEKYDKSIGELLRKLVKQVKAHQKEAVSLEESEKAVAAQKEMHAVSGASGAEDGSGAKAIEAGGG